MKVRTPIEPVRVFVVGATVLAVAELFSIFYRKVKSQLTKRNGA